MAMICNECKGIIPDVMFGMGDRCDCRNHRKPEINIINDRFRDLDEK